MLKKRLLSSVMASIMAVSAFSVVTSADATATTTEAPVEETKAVKTKAELKAYVDGFDAAYKSSVYKFGTYASNRWLKAYAVAEKALTNEKATDEEISNAYYYLETATAKNIPHTFDEVSGLLKTHKAKYDRANILNESLRDLEYTASSYANFETAYSYALSVSATSTEEQLANAYVDLENAANALENTVIVTKTQFAALIKRLDAAKLIRDKYENWRRATAMTVDMFGWGYDATHKGDWSPLTWGDLAGDEGGFSTQPNSWNYIGAFGVVNPAAQSVYLNFYDIKEVSKTSDETIVGAYTSALKTVSAMETFKADSYDRSSSSAVARELNDNYADILFKMAKPALVGESDGGILAQFKGLFDSEANLTAAGKKALTKLDTLKYRATADISGLNLVNRKDAKKVVTSISKGTIIDISDYVSFATASAAITNAEFKDAFDKTVFYVNTAEAKETVYPGVSDISRGPSNEFNVLVDKNTGSVEEWSVVYRFFKYELNDNGIPLTGKTIADLKKRVEESYACDKIESAHFVKWLENVTRERKEAIEVIKANDVDGATAAWNDLDGVINAFNGELARYKYSYGDIAAAIYDATKKVDSGEYVITDDYKNAINATSVALISLIPSNLGEEAFDAYHELVPYNRLRTTFWEGESGEERALTTAMNKLVELTKALEAKPEFAAGDVDGSGKVDTADALLILDYSVDPAKVEGKTFHVEAADVNGDKVVDTADALAALDLAVKA